MVIAGLAGPPLARLKAFKGDQWQDESLLVEAARHAADAGDERVKAEVARRYSGYHSIRKHCFEPARLHCRLGLYRGLPRVVFAQTGGAASEADVQFMRMALDEARAGDFPFGAVIVRDGTVIARGRNLERADRDPTEFRRAPDRLEEGRGWVTPLEIEPHPQGY